MPNASAGDANPDGSPKLQLAEVPSLAVFFKVRLKLRGERVSGRAGGSAAKVLVSRLLFGLRSR